MTLLDCEILRGTFRKYVFLIQKMPHDKFNCISIANNAKLIKIFVYVPHALKHCYYPPEWNGLNRWKRPQCLQCATFQELIINQLRHFRTKQTKHPECRWIDMPEALKSKQIKSFVWWIILHIVHSMIALKAIWRSRNYHILTLISSIIIN